jgi:hypothetical protein
MAVKRYSRAPQHIKNAVRMLYVKALRLANNEPTETAEIQRLYQQVTDWMNGEDRYRKTVGEQEKDNG